MKRILCGLVVFGLFVGSASAHVRVTLLEHHVAVRASITLRAAEAPCSSYQTITFVNETRERPGVVASLERALATQSRQLHQSWDTPCVRFGPDGWILTSANEATVISVCGRPVGGCHSADGSSPFAISTADTVELSHELLEMLVDPYPPLAVEVCDPVESRYYSIDGFFVSDFVLPAWFGDRLGRLDYLN